MKRSTYLLVAIALLLLAAGLRFWAPNLDPPPYDILPDAAPWTDEGTIGLPAVQAARGQETLAAALSDGVRPVQRVLLYGAFKVLGPGQVQGRLLSALTGLVGLAALAAIGRTLWPGAGPLLVLAVAGTGFFFVAYDRLLLTEGPLIALLSLLTLAGLRAHTRAGALAIGVGLAVLAVGFKLHALALVPALALLYALRRRSLLLPFLAGLAVTLLAWRTLFIPGNAPQYTAYLGERLTGEQLGLVSPQEALKQLLTPGLPANYFAYQIPLLILAAIEVMAFCLSPRRWLRESKDAAIVGLVWLAAALVGASVFRYLPPRYFHLASPALLLVALSGARRLWRALPFPSSAPAARMLVTLAATMFLLAQIVAPLTMFGRPILWVTVSGLLLLFAVYAFLAGDRTWRLNARLPLLGGLLVCYLAAQGWLYTAGVVNSKPMLAQAGSEMSASLPPDAVVTGRLAGTLALSTPINGAPVLDQISLTYLKQLARDEQVWVLVLQRDEFKVDPKAWPFLQEEQDYPLDYSRDQQVLRLYRFDGQRAASADSG